MRAVIAAQSSGSGASDALDAVGATCEAMFAAASFGVAIVDRTSCVVYTNARFAELTSGARIMHRPLADACSDGAALAERAAAVWATGLAQPRTYWGDLIAQCHPIAIGEDEPAVMCVVEPDPSLDRVLSSSLSHDLKAPLATVLLWEHVLRTSPAAAEERERALDAIRESARSALRLLERVFAPRASRTGRTLPAATLESSHADRELAATMVAPSPSRAIDGAMLRGTRVLLVDDDDDTREAVAIVLERAGAVVETASSVALAWQAILRDVPDALVSDLEMPDDDGGFGLIARVRAHAPVRRLHAIALTAHAHPEDRRRALTAGFDDYASKPVDADGLVAMVAGSRGR